MLKTAASSFTQKLVFPPLPTENFARLPISLHKVQKETRTNVSLFKNRIYCHFDMQFHLHKTQTNS